VHGTLERQEVLAQKMRGAGMEHIAIPELGEEVEL
jgi:hypothetical protein